MLYQIHEDFGGVGGGESRVLNPSPAEPLPTHPRRRLASTLTGWRLERFKRLRRLFRGLEARGVKGKSLWKALKGPAYRYRKAEYQSAPGRKIGLSQSRLFNLYYGWKRCGDRALIYQVRAPGIEQFEILRFAAACAVARVVTFRQARELIRSRYSTEVLTRNLPPKIKNDLKALHRLRRQLVARERRRMRVKEAMA